MEGSFMATKQRILSFLQNHPEGADDDEITRALGLSYRQQANMRCRELEQDGLVVRRQVHGKIRNFRAGGGADSLSPASSVPEESQDHLAEDENWFWEGNVQSRVISYLVTQGYQIRSAADTASHQQGIDIVAEKNGKSFWVSVKGYPRGTTKTAPSVQAGHWFKQAIFDMIAYRERDKQVPLAVAFPDYPRYRSMANKITWLKPVANFYYFWVKESGEVITE
jgi:hypothetical protein